MKKKEKEIRMKDERMKNKRALARSNATYAFSDPDIGAVFWNRKWICLIGRAKSLRVEQGKKKHRQELCVASFRWMFSAARVHLYGI